MLKPGCMLSGRRMGIHRTCGCASGSLGWWSPSMGMWPAPGAWFWFGTQVTEEIQSSVPPAAPHQLLSHHSPLRGGRGRESSSHAGRCYSHSTGTTDTQIHKIKSTQRFKITLYYQHYHTLPTMSTLPTIPYITIITNITIHYQYQ